MFDMGVYALIRIGWFTKEEPIIHMLPAKHLSAGLGAFVLKRFLLYITNRQALCLEDDLACDIFTFAARWRLSHLPKPIQGSGSQASIVQQRGSVRRLEPHNWHRNVRQRAD